MTQESDSERSQPFPVNMNAPTWRLVDALARYHSYSVSGLEHLPAEGPALVVFNHSLATYDAFIAARVVNLSTGRPGQTVADHLFFRVAAVGDWARSIGAIPGDAEVALSLLRRGELLGVLPGGMREALRGTDNGGPRLDWEGRLGFARLAVRSGAPVICIACSQADEIYSVYSNPVTDFVYRRWRVPLPVIRGRGPTWIPRPVALVAQVSPPLPPPRATDSEDPSEVERLAKSFKAQVQGVMEKLLDRSKHCERGETTFADLLAWHRDGRKGSPGPPRRLPTRAERIALLGTLRSVPIFRGLQDSELDSLARSARLSHYRSGQRVFEEKVNSGRLHLILSGEVEAWTGNAQREILDTLGAGNVCGWETILGRPMPAHYTARRSTKTATWDSGTLDMLGEEQPRLRQRLYTRFSLASRRGEVSEMLRRSATFRSTSPVLVSRLLDLATLDHFARGETICNVGDEGNQFYSVVRGRLRVTPSGESGPDRRFLLYPGDVFGEIALLRDQARNATVVAATDVELLILDRDDFDSLRRAAPGFQREVRALTAERLDLPLVPKRTLNLIVLLNESPYSSCSLSGFLREALISTSDKEVGVLEIGDRSRGASSVRDATDAPFRRLALPRETNAAVAAIDAAAGEMGARYVIVYDPRNQKARSSSVWEQLLATEATAAVYFTPDAGSPFPLTSKPLGGVHYVEVRGDKTLDAEISSVRRAAIRISVGAGPNDLPEDWEQLPAAARAALERLARSLTHRVVGIALSGGGVWGFAHIALLRALQEAGMPVDIIAGTSFGSLVAAVYASRGLDGLSHLADVSGKLQRFVATAAFSRYPLSSFLTRHLLDHEYLEELPIPVLPVAINIDTGNLKTFHRGRITEALHASCALAPISVPALREDGRYRDGGVASNLPVNTLIEEGADFVIASNVIPHLTPRLSSAPKGGVERLVAELSPLGRMRDAIRATYLMAHYSGAREAAAADFTFEPDLSAFGPFEFDKVFEILAAADLDIPHAISEICERYTAFAGKR